MSTISIRYEGGNVAIQSHDHVSRIVGFVNAKDLIYLFDIEDLSANPRTAKVGDVTDSIIESIKISKGTFPFKTKGILVGTTKYENIGQNRFRLHFEQTDYEGILDGGHNMLAIGLYILSNVPSVDQKLVGKIKDWPQFKEFWLEHRDQVVDVAATGNEAIGEALDFVVPVEVVVPTDSDEQVLASFRASLAEICDARNHNVQLSDETLANYQGLYDDFKAKFDPDIAANVQWRQGEEGAIKVKELLAFAMIPLNLVDLPADKDGPFKPTAATAPYNSKATCVTKFNRIVASELVSKKNANGTRSEVFNEAVLSAFEITSHFPRIYDEIYKVFPDAFNATGALFGSMEFVKKASELPAPPKTRYFGQPVNYQYPEGFIMPLVVGMNKLIHKDATGKLSWITDPIDFVRNHFKPVVEAYKPIIDTHGRDPQKVGKDTACYRTVETAIELEMFRNGITHP